MKNMREFLLQNMREFLLQNGVFPKVKGFKYFQEAVKFAEAGMGMCKIYAKIADANGESASKVERAMRYALSKIQSFKDLGINTYPSNSEFISLFIRRGNEKTI